MRLEARKGEIGLSWKGETLVQLSKVTISTKIGQKSNKTLTESIGFPLQSCRSRRGLQDDGLKPM